MKLWPAVHFFSLSFVIGEHTKHVIYLQQYKKLHAAMFCMFPDSKSQSFIQKEIITYRIGTLIESYHSGFGQFSLLKEMFWIGLDLDSRNTLNILFSFIWTQKTSSILVPMMGSDLVVKAKNNNPNLNTFIYTEFLVFRSLISRKCGILQKSLFWDPTWQGSNNLIPTWQSDNPEVFR